MTTYARSVDGRGMAPPENQAHYINKPLPAPPIPHRSLSRNSVRQVPRRPGTAPPTSVEHNLAPNSAPPIPRRSTSRTSLGGGRSMPTSPTAERRSSIKVHQLTGQTVGICFDWTPSRGFSNYASPVLLNDDNSSNYCHSLDDPIYEEEDGRWARSSIPTLVSDDCDDMRSKRSSGGPLSPHSVAGSTTSRTGDRGLYGSAPGSLGFVANSVDELDEDDDDDFGEGDEYHRFTTNLAKVDKQRGRREMVSSSSSPVTRSKSLTSRLSVSARSLFSRRRDSHRNHPWSRSSLDTPRSHLEADLHLHHHAQAMQMHLLQQHSDKSSLNSPPIHSPALSGPPNDDEDSAGPRSVFDYSEDEESDDEETHMREVLRDFFAPARRRGGSDEDRKKKDEARTLSRKGRKQNLRAQIQVIPE